MSFDRISELHGKQLIGPVTDSNLDDYEKQLNSQILVYDRGDDGYIHATDNLVRGTFITDYTKSIKLVINDRALFNKSNANFEFLANDKLIRTGFHCRNEGCFFSANQKVNLDDHVKICTSEQIVSTRQDVYGDPESELAKAIRLGYLPAEAISYRQKLISVFDIETIEAICMEKTVSKSTTQEAHHRIVSLGLGSNIPGMKDKFIMRESSHPDSELKLIREFLDELGRDLEIYIT